jgi:hypothetical protein
VWNNEKAAVAAARSVDPDRWWTAYGAVIDCIVPRVSWYEPLRHAAGLMVGMLSGLDRKNCWTIAEYHRDVTPDGLQHLLARARWDADAVRDDLRDYVIEAFGQADAQPTSARFELVVSLEGLHNTGFSRTPFCLASRAQTVWQYRPVPSLSGLLPPSPASPGSRCPPASTGLLRQPGGEGLSPPLESTSPRGAPRQRTSGCQSRAGPDGRRR